MSIERLTETVLTAPFRRAAEATGADFDYLLQAAKRESGLAPEAKAATSSATGLFQFVEKTWLTLVERYGEKHGVPGAAALKQGQLGADQREALLSLRKDPELAARLAGELTRENSAILQAKLGRAPNSGELYAAHVLGPAGAVRLVRAAEAGAPDAAALFPNAAAANQGLFFDRSGAARSASALLAKLTGAAAPAQAAEARPIEHPAAGWLTAEALREAESDVQKRGVAAYGNHV